MVFRRKRIFRRRVVRRKRVVRRTKVVMPTNHHKFTRYGTVSDLITVSAGSAGQNFCLIKALIDVANYGEFTALYDQFKITKIQAVFQLMNNPDAGSSFNNGAVLNSNNFYPRIWYYQDVNDSTSPTLLECKQHVKVRHKVLRPNQMLVVKYTPAVLNQVYQSAISSGYESKKRQWIATVNSSTPHYGLKGFIDTLSTNLNQDMFVRVEYKFVLEFKDVQ